MMCMLPVFLFSNKTEWIEWQATLFSLLLYFIFIFLDLLVSGNICNNVYARNTAQFHSISCSIYIFKNIS